MVASTVLSRGGMGNWKACNSNHRKVDGEFQSHAAPIYIKPWTDNRGAAAPHISQEQGGGERRTPSVTISKMRDVSNEPVTQLANAKPRISPCIVSLGRNGEEEISAIGTSEK